MDLAIRLIRQTTDEILRKKSREVEIVDDKIREILDDMVETMHKYDGVGLAAPQIGILKRLVVIDLYDEKGPIKLVNPEIVKEKGTQVITLDKDSYFTTTIPYDKGFSVYVDGQKIDYFMTDNAFLGFSLSSGHHIIKLVYHAPLIKVGKYTSLLGLVLFLIFCGKDFIRLWIQILNHFKRKKLTYSNGLSGNIVYQNDSLESNQ